MLWGQMELYKRNTDIVIILSRMLLERSDGLKIIVHKATGMVSSGWINEGRYTGK